VLKEERHELLQSKHRNGIRSPARGARRKGGRPTEKRRGNSLACSRSEEEGRKTDGEEEGRNSLACSRSEEEGRKTDGEEEGGNSLACSRSARWRAWFVRSS
jgi:hypothetical protein